MLDTGTYTIVGPRGGHRTIMIEEHWIPEQVEKGVLVAKYLAGPDNETDFHGFAFLNPVANTGAYYVGVWKRFKERSDIIAALNFLLTHTDRLGEFGLAYAVKSGRCYRCQRKLTVPISVYNGLGKTCAGKLGVSRTKPGTVEVEA